MLKKYQNLGKSLSKAEMKTIKGGIVWPYLRSFECTDPGSGPNLIGGCTDWSTYGINCCHNQHGSTSSPVWGAPYSCSVQVCGNEA